MLEVNRRLDFMRLNMINRNVFKQTSEVFSRFPCNRRSGDSQWLLPADPRNLNIEALSVIGSKAAPMPMSKDCAGSVYDSAQDAFARDPWFSANPSTPMFRSKYLMHNIFSVIGPKRSYVQENSDIAKDGSINLMKQNSSAM